MAGKDKKPSESKPTTKHDQDQIPWIVRCFRRIDFIIRNMTGYMIIMGAIMMAGVVPRSHQRQLPACDDSVSTTLRQLHVFFRHGERMPTSLYPTDPNKPSDIPYGLGRITKEGKQDQYRMGEYLREKYGGFLTADTNEVKARSSDRDRCLESIQTNLAALYAPKTNRQYAFTNKLDWQPVPIHTMPVDIDGMLYEDAVCKRDDEILAMMRTTGEGKALLDKNAELLKYLQANSNKTMTDWVSVRDLLDTLTIEKSIGLKIPSWADEKTLAKMTEMAKYTTILNYKDDERLKIRAGLMIKDMTMHFDDVKQGQRKYKLYMYASHDVLVSAFLSAYEVFNQLAVPSSTAVITELHEQPQGQFQVKMYFRNDTHGLPMKLNIPGCDGTACSLDIFLNKSAKFIPSDWRKECKEDPLPHGVKLYERF